jgi:tRNA G37 N-methylase TrmD
MTIFPQLKQYFVKNGLLRKQKEDSFLAIEWCKIRLILSD